MARRFVKDLLRGREIENLQEEIEDILTKTTGGDLGKAPRMIQKRLFPPMDLHETEEKIIILLDMGGFKKEDIDLEIDENGESFIIKGQREQELFEDSELIEEGRVKNFKKRIELPQKVKTNEIKAKYQNGTLTLKFIKEKAKAGRTIEIE